MCCNSGSKPPNAGCQLVTSICVAFVRVPTTATAPETGLAEELVGQAPPSPAGPIDSPDLVSRRPSWRRYTRSVIATTRMITQTTAMITGMPSRSQRVEEWPLGLVS